MQTRLLLIVFASLSLLSSCKKAIDKIKEEMAITAITDGTWYVEDYKAGAANVTTEFDGYDFKFQSNGTVLGMKSSTTTSGTWTGDANARTINSNFAGAAQPLSRLNGLWKITANDWEYVHANSVINGETCYLKLRKR
jgi:hypothetical protein